MSVKRSYGSPSLIHLFPKPSKEKAKSLSIRLDFASRQASVEFDLTAEAAMALLRNLQVFQKRYGWPVSNPRVITRRDMH